jgi:hypothetical protein
MDFSNRNVQSDVTPGGQGAAARNSFDTNDTKKNKRDKTKWNRIATVVLLVAVAILVGALIVLTASSNTKDEGSYVDTTKLQAVFLNTGQVYFGNIKTLNNKYFVVTNIYYLQTSGGSTAAGSASSNANTNVSLVKLGCELHQPYDQMVINSSQVTFWENLQDNGQVAKAVATFEKQNPNGQKCADQSTSSSSTSNSVQSAGNSSTTPATTPATKP